MSHRVKCRECNSCMSPIWVEYDRYYYCGFCHTYYTGAGGNIYLVESPYKAKIEANKIEDPILEESDDKSTNTV